MPADSITDVSSEVCNGLNSTFGSGAGAATVGAATSAGVEVTSGAESTTTVDVDAGADDYIIKPYRPKELMSRIRAAIRRNENRLELPTKIAYLDLEIDLDGRTITKGSEKIELTLSEFEIVVTLCANPGKVFTRMQLIDRITAYGGVGLERTVDTHISNIRKKLEDNLTSHRYITTVIGIGYKAS